MPMIKINNIIIRYQSITIFIYIYILYYISLYSESLKTDDKVYFESENRASYGLTTISHRIFGGLTKYKETEEVGDWA